MTNPNPPFVVILGSTGTGKSELAVELALRFNGEIVNADAMQMYRGLPVITNKISVQEQRGIPHHLLDHIQLDEPTWSALTFKREAGKVIKEICSRGKLPIVVGGTYYYINGLLFEDSLLVENGNFKKAGTQFPILDGPTDAMLASLREVDPAIAQRWHPNDRRKIRRSLEIFLTTGRPASDIYLEQRVRKHIRISPNGSASAAEPWDKLLLWVYTNKHALDERLNTRVDTMLKKGLLAEVSELYEYVQGRLAKEKPVDTTFGIWQSIGLKQFEWYMHEARKENHTISLDELERLEQAGIHATKTATRHYAKYQTRYLTHKMLPALKEEKLLDRLFLLDSSDETRWEKDVLANASNVMDRFLKGQPLPSPTDLSETAREVLDAKLTASSEKKETVCKRTCEACGTTCTSEKVWQRHVSSRRHRRLLKNAQKKALVAVEGLQAGPRPDPDRDVKVEESGSDEDMMEGLST